MPDDVGSRVSKAKLVGFHGSLATQMFLLLYGTSKTILDKIGHLFEDDYKPKNDRSVTF
jgi:hypothetical protein